MGYDRRLESALVLCDHMVSSLPVSGFKVEAGGGGNWDDEAIENIAGRLGFRLKVSAPVYQGIKKKFRDDKGSLTLVKFLRNRLAHGGISFAECGENVTAGELRDLANRTAAYLGEVVDAFDTYVQEHGFLIEEKRPVLA
jgi:hypothetical protein